MIGDLIRKDALLQEMFVVLERVFDSPREPDKWLQDVRFVLQKVDGKERHRSDFEERDRLRAKRQLVDAAWELASAVRLVKGFAVEVGSYQESRLQEMATEVLELTGEK